VIKFTTLFGLLAVELGVQLASQYGSAMSHLLSAAFLAGSVVFVWRSFYAMRIKTGYVPELEEKRVTDGRVI
jgi:K(+)-stimulated pyrophosphate-energized sodium pump